MIGIDLVGKVALVTGAGQGLGRATATRLHAAGASVVVNYPPDAAGRNAELAREVADGLGERAAAIPADVRDPAQVDAMLSATRERFGRLDLVVNNAAVIRDRTVKKMSDEDWDVVVGTDLTGVFHVCRAAAAVMSDGGRIVNLASISGVVGFFGQANYAAAKAGVIALTKVLSKELASRRITVNAVAPGVVLTDMGKTIPEDVRAGMLAQIPLNRFGEPEEIANAILFLASDLASYITGQTVHVNGGWWS
ncbi:3-oxoacyl-ACP reductase FabG [Paludisphaera mucosa]|uniref:3-oxoacyl-ACP reductase FabG n=1 Tax=Paludisphaera mucosa TaxID=3030827 RepID=A0ABT6F4W1_9BACT|nr:3-oxoacyl-ACP reductase FabG [Paludisphaera mucosa]